MVLASGRHSSHRGDGEREWRRLGEECRGDEWRGERRRREMADGRWQMMGGQVSGSERLAQC